MRRGRARGGFTLLEVMIATIILSAGLVVLLTSFMQCQKVMTASQGVETAQYVLTLGETLYQMPRPEDVTGDPFDDERLNIEETDALKLIDDLEIKDLPRDREKELENYTFERWVDGNRSSPVVQSLDDDEIRRAGGIYTVRTIVRWGSKRLRERPELTVITFWRKKP